MTFDLEFLSVEDRQPLGWEHSTEPYRHEHTPALSAGSCHRNMNLMPESLQPPRNEQEQKQTWTAMGRESKTRVVSRRDSFRKHPIALNITPNEVTCRSSTPTGVSTGLTPGGHYTSRNRHPGSRNPRPGMLSRLRPAGGRNQGVRQNVQSPPRTREPDTGRHQHPHAGNIPDLADVSSWVRFRHHSKNQQLIRIAAGSCASRVILESMSSHPRSRPAVPGMECGGPMLRTAPRGERQKYGASVTFAWRRLAHAANQRVHVGRVREHAHRNSDTGQWRTVSDQISADTFSFNTSDNETTFDRVRWNTSRQCKNGPSVIPRPRIARQRRCGKIPRRHSGFPTVSNTLNHRKQGPPPCLPPPEGGLNLAKIPIYFLFHQFKSIMLSNYD